MKTKTLNRFFILISATLFCLLISCSKENNTIVNTPGTLALHLHTFADTTEVENYGDTLILSDGRHLVVHTAQLYISNIQLIKLDGSVIAAPPTIILLKQGLEEFEVGTVPSGNYKSIRFDVGLMDSINAATPSVYNLILHQPSMWFGSSAQPDGFVFVNFQGLIDTSARLNGNALTPFAYKIGTTSHRTTVTMPDQPYTVVPNQQAIRHVSAIYSRLFENIDLSDAGNLTITTVAQNAGSAAQKIAANIVNMFEYEE